MEPKQIASIPLENGLTLELLDTSRKVAADRWRVRLMARIEIAVTDQGFSNELPRPATVEEMRAKLGNQVVYEYQTERNFVDQNEVASVLQNMQDGVLIKKNYYSHPDFGSRFIIKQYTSR